MSLVASAAASFRVTESTPQRLSFTWQLDGYSARTVDLNGARATVLAFDDQNFDLGAKGEPNVPAYSFVVGTPAAGDIRVSFSSGEVRSVSLPDPVKTWEVDRGDGGLAGAVFAGPWVSQPHYRMFSGHRAAHIVIRPLLYDPSTRTVRILTQGSGAIEFPPSMQYPAARATGDYERMLAGLFVNYRVAATWLPPSSMAKAQAAAKKSVLPQAAMLSITVGDGHDGFNEATTNENGLIRITGDQVLQLRSSVLMSQVALYASRKGEMPEAVPGTITAGSIEIPLLAVDQNGNGFVDAGDYFVAYVTGASDWNSSFEMSVNRQDDYRHYWVVVKTSGTGARMDTLHVTSSGDTVVTSFIDHQYFKRPLQLPVGWEGGIDRIWARLSAGGGALEQALSLPGIVRGSPGWVRFGGPTTSSSYGVDVRFADGTSVCTKCGVDAWSSVDSLSARAAASAIQFVANALSGGVYELGYFEVKYLRRLVLPGSGAMTVFSPPATHSRLGIYRLTGIRAGGVDVFRIPANEGAIGIVVPTISGDTATWVDTLGKGVRYSVSTRGTREAPVTPTVVTPRANSGYVIGDLWSTANSCNYLIVTGTEFWDAALDLAAHKASFGSFANPRPAVVDIRDVYRCFGGGSADPAALRNFLSYAHHNWQGGLQYVLLLGNGHFDPKNTISSERNHIPTFQSGSADGQKCVEGYFTCLDSVEVTGEGPDIFLGRITCETAAEAQAVVDKIEAMESAATADYGAWRNRVLLVADDDMQGATLDGITDHHLSSEAVSTTITQQSPGVEQRKVYLFEYVWDALWEKPEANRALANEINNGVSCVNWFGHGSDELWADEHILTNDNIAALHNGPRYPLFSSFSCSVGRFDAPGHESLSDVLIKLAGGGAIATIGSSRLAYASSNTTLAKEFYNALFDTVASPSVGAAYGLAMSIYSGNQQYCLLGDPSARFVNRARQVTVSLASQSDSTLDELKALQEVTMRGVVLDPSSGTLDPTFGSSTQPAYALVSLFNAPDTSQRKDNGPRPAAPYMMPGAPLFVGQCSVTSGRFEQRMLLPRNVSFGKPGARATAFAWRGVDNGVGYKPVTFSGSEVRSTTDAVGPTLSIRPVYHDEVRNSKATFADRVTLSLPAEIEIEAYDTNGIDVSGVAPDEGLTVEIPGVLSKRNMNTKFRFSEGSFRTGVANMAFQKDELKTGSYTLKITSSDLLGNMTSRDFKLEVVGETQFNLNAVFNFPNPMRVGGTTRFFFYTSTPSYPWDETDGVRVKIKIFSLSGKLLKVLDSRETGAHNGIEWNGFDQIGNQLGPNVYLYQVTAEINGATRDVKKSAIQKLVIHPPR